MKTVPIVTVAFSMAIARFTMVKDPITNLIWEEKAYCEALRLARCASDIK